MEVQVVDSKRIAASCKTVIVPVHCHDFSERSRREVKFEIQRQLRFIEELPNDPQEQRFKAQHEFRNRVACKQSREFKDCLIDLAALKVYALNHPEKRAKKLKVDCHQSRSERAICNIVHRENEKVGKIKDIRT